MVSDFILLFKGYKAVRLFIPSHYTNSKIQILNFLHIQFFFFKKNDTIVLHLTSLTH